MTYENQGSRNMDEVDEVLIEALRILLKEDIEAGLRDGTLPQKDETSVERNEEQQSNSSEKTQLSD